MDTKQIFNALDKMLMSSLSKENDMGLSNGKWDLVCIFI